MDTIREMIAAQRAELASVLARLPGPSWDEPTLCAGWRVCEVVAHITMEGIELRAEDMDWTLGSGAQLTGAAADLMLVLCGRTLPAGRLTGEPSPRFTQPG